MPSSLSSSLNPETSNDPDQTDTTRRTYGSNGAQDDPLVRQDNEAASTNATFSSTGSSNESLIRNRGPVRRPFVSRHRKALNHIATDSVQNLRHPVPSNRRSGDDEAGGEEEAPVEHAAWLCCQKWTAFCREMCCDNSQKTTSQWVETFLPAWSWLKGYPWQTALVQDLIAGMTVGVMIVPQSMSYAKLAGLPVQYGLYSALVPVYMYSLFGSSRQLAVGPVALISLLLSSGVTEIMESEGRFPDDPGYGSRYAQLAVQISFLVGVTNIAMGLMRLGFVTNFLSHAVISGFTSGASVIIGMSQVKYIFGYDVERSDRFHEVLRNIFEHIEQFNWKTFLMGTCSIAALLLMKKFGKTVKNKNLKVIRALGPLTVTTIAIVLSVALGLDEEKGIPLVGDIPSGFPKFTASEWLPLESTGKLFKVTFSIAIVGFMESIAIAKTLASKHKYEIDSSMELIGLGMANLMGGMFQSYPVTGSFSRSAVNNESGAQSGISAMITATLVGLVLLFLTSIFEKLPLSVLAAIVISGVLGLFDYPEAIYLWKVHKFDLGVWMSAFLGTLFLGVEIGLGIAVCVSLLIVIYESAYPNTSVLGRLTGTRVYRNVKQYPEAERYDGIVLVRIDAPLYFANAQNVRDKIRKYRLVAQEALNAQNGEVKYLVMEMSPVSHIDTSALHILEDMYETYLARGQQMCFVNPNMKVMHRMVDSGFSEIVGREHFFVSLHDAVSWCLHEMDTEAVSVHESVNQSQIGSQDEDSLPDIENPPTDTP